MCDARLEKLRPWNSLFQGSVNFAFRINWVILKKAKT